MNKKFNILLSVIAIFALTGVAALAFADDSGSGSGYCLSPDL